MKSKNTKDDMNDASGHQPGTHPFYGQEIIRRTQQDFVDSLLKKYKNEPVTEQLQEKIWNELQNEKHLGNLTIPFKVVMRRDTTKKFPDYIEIILDTKV